MKQDRVRELYVCVCVGGEEHKKRVTVGAITVLKRIISSLKFGPRAGTAKQHSRQSTQKLNKSEKLKLTVRCRPPI